MESEIVKGGGYFITQQVGGKNNHDLSQKIIKEFEPKVTTHTLEHYLATLEKMNYDIMETREAFPEIRFYDMGHSSILLK